jgi:hypothetical protein
MCWRDAVSENRTCMWCFEEYYGALGHINCPKKPKYEPKPTPVPAPAEEKSEVEKTASG